MIKRSDTLRDQAYNLIREKIIRQELPFGARISVAELSREFRISNSPIREAISLLERDGLVNNLPNFGFHVVTLNQKVFNELTQSLRVLLIGCLNDCIISEKTDELATMLQHRLTLQKEKVNSNSFYEYSQYAIAFDRSFVDISGNDMLNMMFENKFSLLVMCTVYVYEDRTDGVIANLKEHEEILASIREKRFDDALRLVYHHFDKSDITVIE